MPKENIGVGIALSYFYGFLQLALSELTEKLENRMKELSRADSNHVVRKFLIIIPESLNCPPEITEFRCLEQTRDTDTVDASRAGREAREYTLPIYKLSTPDTYFIGDVPTCLYALHEAYDRQTFPLTLDELHEARNEFCYTLEALLNHPDNKTRFVDQWDILIWPDSGENKKSLSDFLRQQIESKRLTEFAKEEHKQAPISGPLQETAMKKSFMIKEGISYNTLYRQYPRFPLNHNPRGLCVIINNSKFDKKSGLSERKGASIENRDLKELFEFLKFDVKLHENLTEVEMINFLKMYRSADHSQYDAFVCCILSHGELGRVYSKEGKLVRITDMMKLFYEAECENLRGKPKLFFIEACQVTGKGKGDQTPVTQGTARGNVQPGARPKKKNTDANLIPSSINIIVFYATLPESSAGADDKLGGLYVNALCKYLKKDLEIEFALREISTEVNLLLQNFSKKRNTEYEMQQPFHVVTAGDKTLFLLE